MYRYKENLVAKNVKNLGVVSALWETTGFITNNVHHLQTLQVSSHKKTVGNNAKRYYTTTKKLEIGDKPKSSASHGKILIVVNIFYYD